MSVAEKMTAIADAIRDKTGETEKLGLDAMVDGVNKVYDLGKQAEYDRFWDSFQANGNRRNYPNGFSGSCWGDDTYNPKYEIIVTSLCMEMFKNNTPITSTKVLITIDSTLESSSVFNGCTRLREIPSIKVTEKVPSFSLWFTKCNALTTINFTDDSVIAKSINFQWSPLTVESMLSVLIHLQNNVATDKDGVYTVTFSDSCWNMLHTWAINNPREAEAYFPAAELYDFVIRDIIRYELGWLT